MGIQQITRTVNIHEAETHLSPLMDQAAKGCEVVIAKTGKPMVRVLPLQAQPALKTLGFLAGQGSVAVTIKDTFAADIDAIFGARG